MGTLAIEPDPHPLTVVLPFEDGMNSVQDNQVTISRCSQMKIAYDLEVMSSRNVR